MKINKLMQVIFVHITIFFVILSVKSFTMQANNSNINDMFSGTGSYPLENLSKENRWVKLADALDWKHIYNEDADLML